MTNDLELHETGDGGEIRLEGRDIVTTGAIFNQIYLAFFGGNPGASTTGSELDTEQRSDWWGNSLLFQDQPEIQSNSSLERILESVALDSSGRLEIEEAAKEDLAFLSEVAEITVSTEIVSIDRLEITILAQEPGNLDVQAFIFIWDATKQEVIEFRTI